MLVVFQFAFNRLQGLLDGPFAFLEAAGLDGEVSLESE